MYSFQIFKVKITKLLFKKKKVKYDRLYLEQKLFGEKKMKWNMPKQVTGKIKKKKK